jgi:hypothetical protein
LSASVRTGLGIAADATSHEQFDTSASPPVRTCYWDGDPFIRVGYYDGVDPMELLAQMRQARPDGSDVSGLGADAYYIPDDYGDMLYVDTGSRVVVVQGDPVSREQLETLAQDAITNL